MLATKLFWEIGFTKGWMVATKLFGKISVILQQRSHYVEYILIFQVASTQILSAKSQLSGNRFYTHTISDLTKLLDNWVNTALLQVYHSGPTGLETSWALLTIAVWPSLLPSSAWPRLYPRVFSLANPSLRSCLTDWPRCSLLGQSQLESSTSSGATWWG